MTLLLGFVLKLISAIAAFVVLRVSLKELDKVLDFDFKEWFHAADEMIKGNYLGLRFIGVCILFGFILL